MSRPRTMELAARFEPLCDLLPLILLLSLQPLLGALWAAVGGAAAWLLVAVIYRAMGLRSQRRMFRRLALALIFASAAAWYFLSAAWCSRMEWGIGFAAALCLLVEVVRIAWVYSRLRREMWLPLVAADGTPVGRMARSVADVGASLPAGSLLPVVRVLALCGDMVYLQQHSISDTGYCQSGSTMRCGCASSVDDSARVSSKPRHCGGSGYDTPFGGYVCEGERAEDAARRLIYSRFCGIVRPEVRYLLSYTPRQSDRLVYLFILRLFEPDLLLHHRCPIEGKWWPIKRIEEAPASDFCGYIREELPYINQTVRLAETLRRKSQESSPSTTS